MISQNFRAQVLWGIFLGLAKSSRWWCFNYGYQAIKAPDISTDRHTQIKKGSKVNLHANLIENCMPLNVEMSKTFMHKII